MQAGVRGWTIAEKRVTRPDGRTIDLARHAKLHRIMAILCEKGGRASKEDLVVGAWGVREYHPLRDDNRLHVAARRLRVLLGDDPRAPRWLLTEPDGYALGA
jgi:DNA-binding response OmpR family regulator